VWAGVDNIATVGKIVGLPTQPELIRE